MKTTHGEIEITYNEGKNEWEAEIRGRFRSFKSLAEVREAIDKEPKEKKIKMDPIPVLVSVGYGGNRYDKAVVTSFAEVSRYEKSGEAWVSKKSGRSKERCASLLEDTPENLALIEEAKALDSQAKILSDSANEKIAVCTRIKHPEAQP